MLTIAMDMKPSNFHKTIVGNQLFLEAWATKVTLETENHTVTVVSSQRLEVKTSKYMDGK